MTPQIETSAPPSGPQSSTSSGRPGGMRWVICGLLFLSVSVNYIDRLVIGILKDPLSQRLGWSDADFGHIAAAFSFAYAFGYLFGGRVIDRLGVRKGLPLFVLAWSVAAAAHGLCGLIPVEKQIAFHFPWFSWAERGLVWVSFAGPMTMAGFVAARVALGLTEGGNFPGAIKTIAEWFPVRERALATGWFNAGTNVGAILCPLVVLWIFDHVGWQATFYVTGALGFVWVVLWWWLYETPEKHPRLSAAELAYIKSDRIAQEPGKATEVEPRGSVPLWTLLRSRPVWAFLLASILAAPAWGFYQFFLPDFLKKTFQLSLDETKWWTSAFYIVAAIGGIAGGWLARQLLARGKSVNTARKLAMFVCAVAVLPVCLAPHAGAAWLAVLIVGLAGSAHQGWSANLYCVISDTMPKHAVSSVVGLGGFVAYFTGGFVNEFTGLIVEKTGSYVTVFAYFAGMYLLSLILLQLLVHRIGLPKLPTGAANHPEK